MKIRCRRDKFVPLFTLISSFTATRDTRPALQNVKMVVNEQHLLLTAVGDGLGANGKLPINDGFIVEEGGEAILPAKLLRKILAETNDEEIELELNGSMLAVRGINFRYQLATWPAEDFPVVAPFDATSYHKIATKSLSEMIRRTSFATDVENSHYALGGVLFNFEEDRMSCVATDGRRMAYQMKSAELVREPRVEGIKEGRENEPVQEQGSKAIFPPKTLNLLERAASDAEEAWIAVKEAQAIIRLNNVEISTTLMEGRFPNWRVIMPEKNGKLHVDFIVGDLASAVRQAEIVATEKKPGVWFNFESGKVNIAAAGDEVGESSVDIPISYEGEKTSLRLDSRFLNDFLRCIPSSETLAFYFQPDKPALFETNDDYSYVVMPLT